MYLFEQASALVGVSELRTGMDRVLKLAKKMKVFLGKRHRPVAVLIPVEKYQEMEDALDKFEDMALGYLASKRDKNTPIKNYISLETSEKLVGLKKI